MHPVWWLMWFATVPVLLLSPRVGAWRAFWVSVLAWFFGAMNMWHYLRSLLGVPIVAVLLSFIIPACFFGLAVLAFRAFVRRGALWQAVFAFSSIWVAFEYLAETFSPHSTFGNLGYTQMDCLPLLQIVSLTGIWGISFFLFIFAATCAVILSQRGTDAQRMRLAIAVGALFALMLGYGEWRLIAVPAGAAQQSVKVGLMGTGTIELFRRTTTIRCSFCRATPIKSRASPRQTHKLSCFQKKSEWSPMTALKKLTRCLKPPPRA